MLTDKAITMCLLEILKEYSDEEHQLTMKEILSKMESNYGLRPDRRTIYSAVATLMDLGIITSPILWFQDADYVMGLCIVVALWTSLGTSFLAFIAGLQTIDRSMYEAAAVDGIKNRWQELWYITLPTMRPQLMFGAVLAITNSFGFGAVVDALCGFPSVDYAAHTIMHHLNDYGGARYEVGYASAIAVILFIIMYGSNVVIKKALAKVGE